MGLSHHFARNPQCSVDYATKLNPCRQQDLLFPSIQSSTGCPQTDVRQSNPGFIYTRNGSSNFNELLTSLSRDLVAHLSIPNNDAGDEEDFPIVHDDSNDESAVGNKLSVWADDTTLPPVNTVANLLRTHQFLIHLMFTLNPSAMGYLFQYFQ
jgi:hypothetical protein